MKNIKIKTSTDLKNLDRHFRANFVNSLIGSKQASLIGTVSDTSCTNLSLFSSVTHLGSNPPLVALFSRPATSEPKQTLNNIISDMRRYDPAMILVQDMDLLNTGQRFDFIGYLSEDARLRSLWGSYIQACTINIPYDKYHPNTYVPADAPSSKYTIHIKSSAAGLTSGVCQ